MHGTLTASKAARILVIEDDSDTRHLLRAGLEDAGHEVTEAVDSHQAIQLIHKYDFDVVTLDLKLGNEHALGLARQIKAEQNIPVIMISADGAPENRVIGLEHGADDYIVKPFHMREVIIRIRAARARYAALDHAMAKHRIRYAFDSSVLDIKERVLRHNSGRVVDLTETEFQLLEVFLQHPDRVLSRDELWKFLRGHEWSPFDRAIDGHVSRLRHKIEHAGSGMIKSVRGVGYVFTGDVVRL